MNFVRLWWFRWVYSRSTDTELMTMLDLSIKAGRRVTHDLGHCYQELAMLESMHERATGKKHRRQSGTYRSRYDMWMSIFYPLGGMKDYRSQMFKQVSELEQEVRRLRQLCEENGIDTASKDELPF